MKIKVLLLYVLVTHAAAFLSVDAHAQFREQAFSQQYNDGNSTSSSDSTEVIFSFKEYFAGLQHKQELKMGTMCMGSALVIGGNQIYNRQTWKLPIVYGAIGGSLGAGLYLQHTGNTKAATWCFVGAGLSYWGAMMDGVLNYKPAEYPHSAKATMLSVLVPGLGQIYNKEYWKVPVYLGLMGFGVHYYSDCAKNFNRFRNIYLEATNPDINYQGPISADQALYYRNIYRRYRDYALLAVAAVYLLQIMDANVFSFMHNFEVNDDLSMNMSPTVMLPDYQFASASVPGMGSPAVGLRLGFNF